MADTQTASSLGLVPNDPDKAVDNLLLMLASLQQGNVVLVDDVFYISGGGDSTLVSDHISLRGLEKGRLIINNRTTKISFIHSLDVQNVIFEAQYTGTPFGLFTSTGNAPIDDIIIKGCSFHGNIYGLIVNRSSEETPSKISRITVDNNFLEDRSGIFALINGADCDYIKIRNNVVHNMGQQIFNINGVKNPKLRIIIQNNDVSNDMDYWVDTTGYSYLCFVLFAGKGYMTYRGNSVSGLKTRSGPANVYDSYLSCSQVEYDSNSWRDNVTVSPERGRNSLFKSKAGAGEEGMPQYKSCRNSTFKVTKDLISQLTPEELSRCSQTPWEFAIDIDYFVFENNDIDVYRLLQRESDSIRKMKIVNNVFHAEDNKGSIFMVNPIDNESELLIMNNHVVYRNADPNYTVVSQSGSTVRHKSVEIIGNTFDVPFTTFATGIITDEMVFSNNQIRNNSTTVSTLFHYTTVKKLTGRNNLVDIAGPAYRFRPQCSIGETSFEMVFERRGLPDSSADTFPVELYANEKTKHIYLETEAFVDGERRHFLTNATIGRNENGVYTKYLDVTGIPKEVNTAFTSRIIGVERLNSFGGPLVHKLNFFQGDNPKIQFRYEGIDSGSIRTYIRSVVTEYVIP